MPFNGFHKKARICQHKLAKIDLREYDEFNLVVCLYPKAKEKRVSLIFVFASICQVDAVM